MRTRHNDTLGFDTNGWMHGERLDGLAIPSPFALSLSKGCPSSCSMTRRSKAVQRFDRLSTNGEWGASPAWAASA